MEFLNISQQLSLLWDYIPLDSLFVQIGIGGVVLYLVRCYVEGGQFRKDAVKMDGKVVIVTGANSGIGKETALDLARRNAKIYLACRDPQRCEAARQEIIEKTGNTRIYNRHLNLGSLQSVREFAEAFAKEEQHLDVLINNAGVLYLPHAMTEDGCEIHMQTNHLGHFLLTHLLLELLKKAPQGRVVNVSSLAAATAKFTRDDLHMQKPGNFIKWKAYANSKLAQILTTQTLAEKLKGTNVTVYSLHPGVIYTDIVRHLNLPKIIQWIFFNIMNIFVNKSLKSGAQTTICCAVDPDLATVSGKYFSDCKEVKYNKLPQQVKNGKMNDFIWQESLRLAKIPSNFAYN